MQTKKTIGILLLFVLSVMSVLSATTNAPAKAPPPAAAVAAAPAAELFRANEVQIDLNGFTRSEDIRHYSQGAGIGVNYFPWRAAGFGIDAQGESLQSSIVDRLGVALIGRMPIDKAHFAPEFRVGYQYDFERGDDTRKYYDDKGKPHQVHVEANGNEVFASIGGEVRFDAHWGVGVEVRGAKPLDPKASEYVLGIVRVRFSY